MFVSTSSAVPSRGGVWWWLVVFPWCWCDRCGGMCRDVMWYDVKSCDVMWCQWDVVSCQLMWCTVMWCDVMSCEVMWCNGTGWTWMGWLLCGCVTVHVAGCEVMSCDAMWLCYVVNEKMLWNTEGPCNITTTPYYKVLQGTTKNYCVLRLQSTTTYYQELLRTSKHYNVLSGITATPHQQVVGGTRYDKKLLLTTSSYYNLPQRIIK